VAGYFLGRHGQHDVVNNITIDIPNPPHNPPHNIFDGMTPDQLDRFNTMGNHPHRFERMARHAQQIRDHLHHQHPNWSEHRLDTESGVRVTRILDNMRETAQQYRAALKM
jgi:hypothetical protein